MGTAPVSYMVNSTDLPLAYWFNFFREQLELESACRHE